VGKVYRRALVSKGGRGGPGRALRVEDLPGSGMGPGDKVVTLTFDDGPDPSFTPRVLDVLSHYQCAPPSS
jgi:peptidoglycan/xylan/chitin deacetylase (PgdA/CDA1 family)